MLRVSSRQAKGSPTQKEFGIAMTSMVKTARSRKIGARICAIVHRHEGSAAGSDDTTDGIGIGLFAGAGSAAPGGVNTGVTLRRGDSDIGRSLIHERQECQRFGYSL